MSVYDELVSLIPRKKRSPNGWISFNAPCCIYNGESRDTKGRGGIVQTEDDGVSYHCFNCGWKTSYRPGRNLGQRMKSLFKWLGATDDQINRIAFECMKIETEDKPVKIITIPEFEPRELPKNSRIINEALIESEPDVIPIVEYIYSRSLTLGDREFLWSDEPGYRDRMIIPLTVDHKIVGYIARKITEGKPKYLTEHPPHIVFNLDNQRWENSFLLVFEGSIDAILLDGVATLTNEISDEQAFQISKSGKRIIVVPDQDKPGEKMIYRAIDLGWSVSFPEWGDDIKDAAESVSRYGRLATMINIIKNIESTGLKIKLRMKI